MICIALYLIFYVKDKLEQNLDRLINFLSQLFRWLKNVFAENRYRKQLEVANKLFTFGDDVLINKIKNMSIGGIAKYLVRSDRYRLQIFFAILRNVKL